MNDNVPALISVDADHLILTLHPRAEWLIQGANDVKTLSAILKSAYESLLLSECNGIHVARATPAKPNDTVLFSGMAAVKPESEAAVLLLTHVSNTTATT